MVVKHGVLLAAASALAFALVATPAKADPACISAYEQTQTLRKDGKLSAAKAQAVICARDSCPALLTRDCSRWLAELEVAIPTVVLDARTPAGGLRADVRVKLDGAPLAEKIDGKPLIVEPGSHVFVFEAEGAATVEERVVVREGEKLKKISATMAPSVTRIVEGSEEARPIPLAVWVFGGVSVVSLATSAIFAIDGFGKKSDLDQCKPRCASADVDAMSASFTLADVALGAGVVATAATVYLFLTRPSREGAPTSPSSTARLMPFATPLVGGGAGGVMARF